VARRDLCGLPQAGVWRVLAGAPAKALVSMSAMLHRTGVDCPRS
jgi:hypothetical protein